MVLKSIGFQHTRAQAFSVFLHFMVCYIPFSLNKKKLFTYFPGMHTLELSYTAGEIIIGVSTLGDSLTVMSKVKEAISPHVSGIM